MSLNLASTIKLSDGRAIPQLGLGVYLSKGKEGEVAMQHAFKNGYRHLDGAQWYRNEAEMGRAFHASGLKREDVWITTKVTNHGYEKTLRSVDESLAVAKLDYYDLFLLHSPNPGRELRLEAWRGLIDAQKAGKVKSIGVSNYGVHHIQELLEKYPNNLPVVNQIEYSPFFQRNEIVRECLKHDIKIQSYSPLGKGAFVDLPELKQIADVHKKTPSQLLIRYVLQKGHIVIPKSVTPSRIEENADVYDFELSGQEIAKLDALETGSGVTWDPTKAP
ncbi:putative 2,5-didehydrogluconate reductase [Ceraceosorus guamensis]|uniref:Putative 2,5-didehydrogluconate reductase n=1 Tax=Ceraceosorus guamensis TaxID=1522189 RepID=A0A316W1M5_9BASI|nr:putative 2,5-didehydrogluconate reductase [Ceraceosorus guamensis]PWN43680.1 putative 2,5-didehydrogluconate reductase [Ceraceosorus guamensis]